MRIHFVRSRPLWLLLTSTALLAVATAPVHGQFRLFHGTRPDYCPPPPCPTPPVQEPAPTPPGPPSETKPPAPTAPAPAPTVTEPSISPEARAATGTGTVALAAPAFKGDQVPIVAIAFGPPQNPNGGCGAAGP